MAIFPVRTLAGGLGGGDVPNDGMVTNGFSVQLAYPPAIVWQQPDSLDVLRAH